MLTTIYKQKTFIYNKKISCQKYKKKGSDSFLTETSFL